MIIGVDPGKSGAVAFWHEGIDKGCKHRDPYYVEIEASSIVASIIDIFDGEFVDTPMEKRSYSKSKEWWKEKPKHKYTERKDW